tara:strand:+ start:199 stop:2361 length:2163 start_codon:yes stop_codon:yes gene_type:complete
MSSSLIAIDSWYRSVWPSGYVNWHNHIHTASETELADGNWVKYADNEFYFFISANSAGTNGEVMKEVRRYFSPTISNHLYATTDAEPDPSYNREGRVGYVYQNNGTNRTAIYRFRKNYSGSSGYGAAEIQSGGNVQRIDRIDHRCGLTNIGGVDGWIFEGIMGYVPYQRSGCTDPSANNYDAYANNDDGSCSYITAPTTSITAKNSSNVAVTSIYRGQSVNIAYSSTNGGTTITTSFTATANGVTTNPISSVGSSGTYSFSPVVQTTYKFTAVNSVGSSTSSVTVSVLNDNPVLNFYTNKTNNTLNRGESITITWSATANQTITSTTVTGVTNPGASGSTTITPSSPGTVRYVFTATNPSGTSSTFLDVTTVLLAPTASLTSSDADNTIIAGESVVLTWEALGFDITSYAMTGVVNPGAGGNITVSPTTTTTYTYTIINDSGTSSDSIVLTVYTPPTCTLSVDDNPLIGGDSTTLRWLTTGDADTIQWTQGGNISAANEISGNLSINPTSNKTYQARVSGLGGTVDSNELNLVVVYLPIIHTWDVPNSYDYGSTTLKTFEYNYQYANNSATVTFVYVYKDEDGNDVLVTQPNPISLPTSSGASGGGNSNRLSGTFTYVPTWTEFGPRSILVTIEVSGSGGNLATTETININIDERPNNINPEDSVDKLANEISYTPNDEDAVISDLYRIDDIDIPVEIKSDHEIQVRINDVDLWNNVREL